MSAIGDVVVGWSEADVFGLGLGHFLCGAGGGGASCAARVSPENKPMSWREGRRRMRRSPLMPPRRALCRIPR